jgi:hypothetical protein
VGIGTTSPTVKLQVTGNTMASNFYTGTGTASAGTFGADSAGTGASIIMYGSTGANPGAMILNAGSSERMRIDSGGNFLVGTTTTNPGNASNVKGFGVENSTGSTFCSRSGDAALFVNRVDTTGAVINMKSATVTVGSIAVTSSATAYNTSSDYRLKNSVVPMTIGLATVNALKPVTYKWNVDDSAGEGFIAHELQAVIPHAVTGEKDAVDADGNPIHQGVDYSKIVVHLVAAVQEQQATITALTARIATLEAK